MIRFAPLTLCAISILALAGCNKQPSDAAAGKQSQATAQNDAHTHANGQTHSHSADDHDHDYEHDHDHDHDHDHAHGPAIELGTATIGDWTVRAARDQGEITPGGDAPIDAWLTGGTSRIAAVRFWIGTQDAANSIKARAEIENPNEPDHWHTHVEVPDPLPPGSQLWVELEIEGQGKQVGSFELGG